MTDNIELPEDWKAVRLGDYAKTEKGRKPKAVSKEQTNEFAIPYVNIKAFEKGIIDEYTNGVGCVICEDDDFLMVWDGSRSGYVGKAIRGALASTLVRIKLPEVDHDFAFYFLQSKFIEINSRAKGVGIPHVDPSLVWNYNLPLPPKETQQQIVSKIEELFSELDKGTEELKTTGQQLKVYRQAVLKWAFEGKLTNEDVKDGELPNGWKYTHLGEIIEQPKYGTSKKCDYKKVGKGVLRIPNIKDGRVDDSDLKYAEFDNEEIETYSLKEGDLLTIRSNGSVDIVGKCAMITKQSTEYLYAGYLIRLRPMQSIVNPRYLLHVISSSNLRNQIESKAKSTSGVNNINSDELKSLVVPMCSLEEQQQVAQEIESRLSVCDKIEETINNNLKRAEALRQGLLKKAFEGKLISL